MKEIIRIKIEKLFNEVIYPNAAYLRISELGLKYIMKRLKSSASGIEIVVESTAKPRKDDWKCKHYNQMPHHPLPNCSHYESYPSGFDMISALLGVQQRESKGQRKIHNYSPTMIETDL